MKNTFAGLALLLALAGCSDNKSADDSQNNTSTAMPHYDSVAHAHDSATPNIENTGASNPNTVNSAGNHTDGSNAGPAAKDSAKHPTGVSDGTAPSRDSMSKGRK